MWAAMRCDAMQCARDMGYGARHEFFPFLFMICKFSLFFFFFFFCLHCFFGEKLLVGFSVVVGILCSSIYIYGPARFQWTASVSQRQTTRGVCR
ncbi:hypothetical protein BS50DRAFT_165517 [Corynespora cassiicola Philippines]|uniref:Uncharacterized protein n=1 Tax=Corynespora cassiicola Philippines TaxID=1448308 RepID=A0A2T2P4T7_CORCC|nr:hypothetical protein BS50DRAFT_165517 [Corynespora cassiicola Philippines]